MFYASEYVTYYSLTTGEEASNTCSYQTFDNITDAINYNQKRFDDMFPDALDRKNVEIKGNVSGKIEIVSFFSRPGHETDQKKFVRHILTVTTNKPF